MLVALWSINERLAGKNGVDLGEPTTDWWTDFIPMEDEVDETGRDDARGLLEMHYGRTTMGA